MKSPFPGMDPYMERRWRGVHNSLIVFASGELNARMGPGYVAEIDERLIIELPDMPARDIYPDVYAHRPRGTPDDTQPETAAGVATLARSGITPSIRVHAEEPRPQAFVKIIETTGGLTVTVIEFVLAGEQIYRRRPRAVPAQTPRPDCRRRELRRNRPDPRRPPERRPLKSRVSRGSRGAAYLAFARRGFGQAAFDVYPMPLREPLPTLGIPLRPADQDVPLNLQGLIHRVYDEGRFAARTNYADPLRPALAPDDAEWAKDLLADAKVDGGS